MSEFTVQIYIPAVAGVPPARNLYQTNLNGLYNARLTGVVWCDDHTTKAGDRTIRIVSSQFQLPYGSYPNSFIVCNSNDHNLQVPQGHGFGFKLDTKGLMDLEFFPSIAYDNTNGNTFKFAVLTFEVEKQ